MLHPFIWLAMFVAVAAHTGAAICFKKAAQSSGARAFMVFVLGNAIGFLNPVFKTIALRNNHPNVIFAIMGGVGGVFFILVINWVFRSRLTRFQWLAILIIILGSVLLQLQPTAAQ